jgi:predicted transglutaminase-like cysteine proteinase
MEKVHDFIRLRLSARVVPRNPLSAFKNSLRQVNCDRPTISILRPRLWPFWLAAALISLTLLSAQARDSFRLDRNLLESVEQNYGRQAKQRLLDWQNLINDDQSANDLEKLVKVNVFFNQQEFISDLLLWKDTDYWATPVEFLAQNGGDCEDFSIAKYFTLKKLGIDEDKLNLTYAKAVKLDQAHMVVTYYAQPNAEPLILDNLDQSIKPASERPDLLPVFSFNGIGLWLAKERGRGKLVGTSSRYKHWQDLQGRMPEGLN